MKTIAELIAAFRAGELKLLDVFEALNARGAAPEADYRADVEYLERLHDESALEPNIIRALRAKLDKLQDSSAAVGAAADESGTAPLAPEDAEITLVQPSAGPTPPTTDDISVFTPGTRSTPTDTYEITVVKPAAGTGAEPLVGERISGTSTSSGISASQSTWQRVSEAAAGDYVSVGSLLKNRFYLEQEIGRGGMGVVYKARDERKVEARDRDPYLAIKVLNDEFRRHPDSLIALQRESRRSQQLAHDNIVRVFDFDKDGSVVFMTMEYIEGYDLKTLIREHAYGGLPLSEARPLIEGMARALDRAHAAGVVHSDFKPGNVMVTREGVPKVFDFGIARAGSHVGDVVGEQTVFDAGTLGALTPAYASLEMIQGKESGPSDDIYALGCVVFELLTGKHPFDKVSAEVAMKEGRKPPPVPGLTKRQYSVLCSSIAFTREQRLKSAQELLEGLRDISLRERATPYLIYGAIGAVLLAAGTWGLIDYRHSRKVATVISRFSVANPDHYASASQALKSLDSLSANDRKQIVIDHSEQIQNFLLNRIDAAWNPKQGHYDYPKAQQVFGIREQLRLYSPKLDVRRSEVDMEKNDLLNALDTQLSQQIDAGAIFETRPDNAAATLARIRMIDPHSALLNNAELELKYDAAISQSLDAGKVDVARKQLALASRLFPQSARLKQRSDQLAGIDKTLLAQQQQQAEAQRLQQQREHSLQTLQRLLDHPDSTIAWRMQSAGAYRDARKSLDDDPRLSKQADRFKRVLATQAEQAQTAGNFKGAIDVAGFGIDLFPGDAALAAARQKLLNQQNRLAQEAQTKAQHIEKTKDRVDTLLAQPLGTAVWLQDVESGVTNASAAMGAQSPAYAVLRRDVNKALIQLAQQQLKAGDLDAAERVARVGRQIDPAQTRYAGISDEIARARVAASEKARQQQAQTRTNARKALTTLSAEPTFTSDWQHAVIAAVDALHDDNSPATRRAIDALGDAIAAAAAKLADPQHLPQARLEINFGLKLVPQSSKLREQDAKLASIQRTMQAKADQESADAEVLSRIESLKRAAAANDIAKARESLARIRSLEPQSPFLKVDGPQLVADAYIGAARNSLQKGRYQSAADILGQGLNALGNRTDLRQAKALYDVVAAIMKAGLHPLPAVEYRELSQQLTEQRRADPSALSKLEEDMRVRGLLREKSLRDRLETLKPSSTPGGLAAPAIPSAAPQAKSTPKPQVAPSARSTSGPDPCDKPGLSSSGSSCFDTVDGRHGPRLVVVPGLNGGKPYAMSRAEISVFDFNLYCKASKQCVAKSPGVAGSGEPITDISVAQAKAYMSWMTTASGGFVYRLPTDAEWLHAAKANAGWKQAQNSNCVLPSAGGDDFVGALVSARGRDANPWGLVNMTGNVWEWVTRGSTLAVRGGSFNSYWSDCTVEAHRDDSGKPEKDVGFRVLRELK